MPPPSALVEGPESPHIVVWVVPRSRRDGAAGYHNGALRVRVSAPPADGKANKAVAGVLRAIFGVRPQLVWGTSSRRKVFALPGMTMADAARRLDDAAS